MADNKIIESIDSNGLLHLSNILSVYTGNPLTYTQTTKVITDSSCDGNYFRKYKGIYVEMDTNGVIDVREFGAKGDGITDDTASIQKCLNVIPLSKAKTVSFPSGTFMVKADNLNSVGYTDNVGLSVKSGTTIMMENNTILKAISSSLDSYSVLYIGDATDVSVYGGNIKGERTTHIGTVGEHGMGVHILNSSNITIDGTKVTDCWGDGIAIRATGANTNYSQYVRILNVYCSNNRRQGLTIGSAKKVWVLNSEFSNTNGTDPQYGIDIEPNPTYPIAEDIYIDKNTFNNNVGGAIVMGGTCNNTFITNNDITVTTGIGINIGTPVQDIFNLKITGNLIKLKASSGAMSLGNTLGFYCNNVEVSQNTLLGDEGAITSEGITFGRATNLTISNNNFKNLIRALLTKATTVDLTVKVVHNDFTNVDRVMSLNCNLADSLFLNNRFSNITLSTTSIFTLGLIKRSKICGNIANSLGNNFCSGISIDNDISGNYINNSSLSNPIGIASFTVSAQSSGNKFSDNIVRNTNIAHPAFDIRTTALVPNQVINNNASGLTSPFDLVVAPNIQSNNFYIGTSYAPIQVMSAVPTSGTWVRGQEVRTDSPIDGGSPGWICVVAGTFGALAVVTGSITTGTTSLTLSSVVGLKKGDYINIVGVGGTKRIIDINGSVVTLNVVANATVSGATVQYVTPVFSALPILGTFSNTYISSSTTVPTPTGSGKAGEIRFPTDGYIYFCKATNVWERVAKQITW